MKHQALYRRYRPQTFAEVIGQEHITTSLKHQIKNGNVSHAYIFNGTRGVGKTSVARIFARAVNCLDNADGEPCNACKLCTDYIAGGNVDIIEIDAASNNGVQDARELADRVTYTPNYSEYKVYIIDEAHMITNNAFNALLKTIEEPPEHVIFILCTTEIENFPATILSRCMRFDFHMVSVEDISSVLKKIFADLNIDATDEAVTAIANAGEGSVRDALTIADRCVALADKLTYETVIDVLGATNKDTLIRLADFIINNDADGLLNTVIQLVDKGKSVAVLTRDLARHFRDLVIIKTCKDAASVLSLPKELFAKLQKSASAAPCKKLMQGVEVYSQLEARLRSSLSPQVLFEAVTLRLASSSGEIDADGLDMRLSRLERAFNSGAFYDATRQQPASVTPPTVAPSATPPARAEQRTPSAPPAPAKSTAAVEKQPSASNKPTSTQVATNARELWTRVLNQCKTKAPMIRTVCQDIGKVNIKDGAFQIHCNATQYNILNDKLYSQFIIDILAESGLTLQLVKEEGKRTLNDIQKVIQEVGGNVEIE